MFRLHKFSTPKRTLQVLIVWVLALFSIFYVYFLSKKISKLEARSETEVPHGNDIINMNNRTQQFLGHGFDAVSTGRKETVLSSDSSLDVYMSTNGTYSKDIYSPPSGEKAVRRLPQAIIFGVGKCGTRALIEYLRMNPYIVCPGPEVHFFDIDNNFEKGLDWYQMRMPKSYSNQLTLEKSPSYYLYERAAEEIYKMNKSIKLIFLIRDPVRRILTQIAKMPNPEDHEGLYLEIVDGKPKVKETSATVTNGLYVNYLKIWMKRFALSQILIIEGNELVTQPAAEIQKAQKFLGVPQMISERNFYYNATKGFYCNRSNSGQISCLGSDKGLVHPQMTPVAQMLLYDFYKPYNEKLFQLVKRRFDWDPGHL